MQKGGIGEPEKGAITDALKRCARLFGVGRYILDMGNMKDMQAIGAWLNAARKNAPKPPPSVGNPTTAITTPETVANAANALPTWTNTPVGECWSVLKAWLVSEKVYTNDFELKNSFIKRGISDGKTIADEWKHKPARELIAFVKARHAEVDIDFMGEQKASGQ